MVITGLITLIVAVVFWCVYPDRIRSLMRPFRSRNLIPPHDRFFFPDSPTNAWFLTNEERAMAIERIKVNQSGVENKRWKKDQCVLPRPRRDLRPTTDGANLSKIHRNLQGPQSLDHGALRRDCVRSFVRSFVRTLLMFADALHRC